MSQAELAGGKPTSADEVPSKGHRLRDFELMSSEGKAVCLSAVTFVIPSATPPK